MAFADAHAEYHRWTDGRTIAAHSSNYHQHDDSSSGNQDIAWLRPRTTVINAGLFRY